LLDVFDTASAPGQTAEQFFNGELPKITDDSDPDLAGFYSYYSGDGFSALRHHYLTTSEAEIVLYDTTDRASFDFAEGYLRLAYRLRNLDPHVASDREKVCIMLCGNKIDKIEGRTVAYGTSTSFLFLFRGVPSPSLLLSHNIASQPKARHWQRDSVPCSWRSRARTE
jgi:GTPase SAR1 family protein